MQRKGNLFYCLAGMVVLFLISGCTDTPPSIQFDTPDGYIMEDSGNVSITGKVVKGTNAIRKLELAGGLEIPIDPDGSFEKTVAVNFPDDSIFSTTSFVVSDTKLIKNKQNITFVKGIAATPTFEEGNDDGTLSNAVNMLINEDMVNQMADEAQTVINEHLQEIIDDMGMLPVSMTQTIIGIQVRLTVTALEMDSLTFDHITIGEQEGWIKAENIDLTSVNIAGYFTVWGMSFPFTVQADNVHLDEMDMEVFLKDTDSKIRLRLDVDDLDSEFWDQLDLNVTVCLGWLCIPLDGLLDIFKNLMGDIFRLLFDTLSFIIMDVNDLAMTIDINDLVVYGIPINLSLDVRPWFPTGEIYTTYPGQMAIDVGVALKPTEENPLYPFNYYSTPTAGGVEELLPTHTVLRSCIEDYGPNNNLIVGLNDDMINMALAAAIRAGVADGLDVSSQFRYLAGSVLSSSLFRQTQVMAYLNAPPIADLSDVGVYLPEEDGSCYAGKYLVRNAVVEVSDLLSPGDKARACVDVDAAIYLKLSEDEIDGTPHIDGFMNNDESSISINYLYYNNANLTNMTKLVRESLMKYIMDRILKAMINIDIDPVELYGASIQPHIYKIEVGGGAGANNMLLWLGATQTAP